MKKQLLCGLIGLFSAHGALAMDLMETYEKALSYDSGIAAARASLRAQEATADISRSALLPQISAYGDANHIDSDGPNQDVSYQSYGYGVQLTQPLFRAEAWFAYDAAQLQTEAARAEYNLAQQQLILDVATAYFDVLRAADALTTARATENAIQRQYDQAQERFDVGLIAITEVYEARASYDDATARRIAAENELDIARERLARLTGEYTEELENLKQDFPLIQPVPANPNEWEQTATSQNWQIQTAIKRLQASKANLDEARAGHYPTLDLNASYGRQRIDGLDSRAPGGAIGTSQFDGTTTEGRIGLSLNVPLYAGGGIQAGVRQQRASVDVQEQNLNTTRRDVRVNTRSLYRTVNTNIEAASALDQTIVSRRSALDATLAGYDVGTRNIVEVLDAQRAYYVALRDYANARYDYVVNTLGLKQAAGTLSPQDLMELNRWLSESAPGIEALANESDTIEDPTTP
ncbi:outer membrane protein [Marinobacter daqiaonensis]|uniref:Outer membrane protein n=1 Tax=Marinobacter daqiaonensis TaxID=650891 RepID=A0A1I6K2L2_9GAMM|nr:TolC family outer membrane protein [Marinobacter daqiaonensis]SFR85483.1 outer membrane protein [Marinobacter daqiaonensis]